MTTTTMSRPAHNINRKNSYIQNANNNVLNIIKNIYFISTNFV